MVPADVLVPCPTLTVSDTALNAHTKIPEEQSCMKMGKTSGIQVVRSVEQVREISKESSLCRGPVFYFSALFPSPYMMSSVSFTVLQMRIQIQILQIQNYTAYTISVNLAVSGCYFLIPSVTFSDSFCRTSSASRKDDASPEAFLFHVPWILTRKQPLPLAVGSKTRSLELRL